MAERVPVLGVRDGFVQRCRADAERLGGDRDAPALERPHGEAEPLVDRTQDLVVADADVEIEVGAAEAPDAEGVGARGSRDARRVHRHQERRHPLTAQARPRAREHDGDGGRFGVRDPDFPAADPVARAASDGPRLLIGGVGAGVRLREREGAYRLARRQPSQPLLFLRRPAGMRQQLGDQRIGDRQRHRNRRARLRDRLDRQRVAHVIEAGATPPAWNGHPEQAAAGGRPHDVERKLARLVDRRRTRGDHLLRELARSTA